MKRHIIPLLFLGLGIAPLSAQTLAQGKSWYEAGRYAEAKPVFQKYVKSQPGNGNYSLWYGVCCLKTGDPAAAVSPLETAVKKRIPSGQLYLGQAYHGVYRFDDAVRVFEEYIAELIRRNRSTELADGLLAKSRLGQRLIKGVEEVCVVDSVVVDKKDFLSAYRNGPESGRLFMYNAYFKDAPAQESTVFETELGNRIYYAERQEGDTTYNIVARSRMADGWSRPTPLSGAVNEGVNANYPYVMSDGVTVYYAGDGPGSLGGYDIFVTRYNTANDTYLNPENVGMPFNSPFNDYLYVVDEYNNLGWFASDRYQPEGKVCIYTFVPNLSKRVYDYEHTDKEKLKRLASLHTISESWTDPNTVAEARQRLEALTSGKEVEKKAHDFEFIIDDETTYYHLADFRSPEAKEAFNSYRRLQRNYKQTGNKLKSQRNAYIRASEAERKKMTPGILDLEKRMEQLANDLKQTAIRVRNLEKQNPD